MAAKQSRRKRGPQYPSRDLSYVTDQGGRTRRHRYLSELRVFLLPVCLTIALTALVYVLIITRDERSDWGNILSAIVVLSGVPILSAATLAAFRRHGSPIVASTVVSVAWFSVAVSVLSAMRIPVSYQGIAACLPVVVFLSAVANIRFQRTLNAAVALLPFHGAQAVAEQVGGIPILSGPDADIGDLEILMIDPNEHHSNEWSALLTQCYLSGVEIMPWSRYLEVRLGRLDVGTFEIAHLAYSPSQIIYARCKRLVDLVAVLLSLPITLPIAALVAVYIGLRDGFPVIFVQVRRGYGGRRFRMYKFRTMYKGSEGGSTAVADNRVIPGCGIIRKLRFDEIPQLYNILRGDMSLIGPRPVAEYVARSSAIVEPKYELRSLVLPGITGWAQIKSGYAGNTEEELEKLSYDLYYIKHLSLDLDLVVLFKTVQTVLFGVGAR